MKIARNFDPNNTQFLVGLTSISWLILAILDLWINIPAYKNVQILIANVNVEPASSILQVLGRVEVPKTFPSSESPIKFINKPTKTMHIKGQLFTITKKSTVDNFQSVFYSFLNEKSKLILGKLIFIIPPKFDLVILLDSLDLKEKLNAFWLKLKIL